MAALRVKAAHAGDGSIIFDADGAGLAGDFPTQGIVRSDGKVVTLEGRHVAVKAALRDGLLVEVKGGHKAEPDAQ
jgi:hypothetical protein